MKKDEEENEQKERCGSDIRCSDKSDIPVEDEEENEKERYSSDVRWNSESVEDSCMDKNVSPRVKQERASRNVRRLHRVRVNATVRGENSQGQEVDLGTETHCEGQDHNKKRKSGVSSKSNGTKKRAKWDTHENVHFNQLSDSSDGSTAGLPQAGLAYKRPW